MSTVILGLVRQGDHVVAQRTHCMGTTQLLSEMLPRFGVAVSVVDQADLGATEEAIKPNPRLWFESTNGWGIRWSRYSASHRWRSDG